METTVTPSLAPERVIRTLEAVKAHLASAPEDPEERGEAFTDLWFAIEETLAEAKAAVVASSPSHPTEVESADVATVPETFVPIYGSRAKSLVAPAWIWKRCADGKPRLMQVKSGCGTGAGGFQPGNKCASGGGSAASGTISTKPHYVEGAFSPSVAEEIEDSNTDAADLRAALDEGESHEEWETASELSEAAKEELKNGGMKLLKYEQEASWGEGSKLTLYNASHDGSESFAGKFFAFDESASVEYARESSYEYLREVAAEIPYAKLADQGALLDAAEAAIGERPDYAFEAADSPKVQSELRSRGFVAVRFADMTPNNEREHDTILFLADPGE